MDREAEIARIKHELDILRARHALYAKWGRILKLVIMPLIAAAFVAVAVMIFTYDALYAIFFICTMCAVVALILLYLRDGRFGYAGRRFGWIDLASPPIRFTNRYADLGSFLVRRRPSDAQMIEEQIAERELRLAELGVAP